VRARPRRARATRRPPLEGALVAFADLAERLGLRWYVFVQLQPIGDRRVPVISAENLIVTKLLAARPKDLEDVRELVASRGASLDHERIDELLALLEQALGQSDLIPLYRQLRDEAARG
jgi:hypothetical protein